MSSGSVRTRREVFFYDDGNMRSNGSLIVKYGFDRSRLDEYERRCIDRIDAISDRLVRDRPEKEK